ncbi:MAG: hypothetical protein WBP12_05390 [Candidatus Saccharimonas sp.]
MSTQQEKSAFVAIDAELAANKAKLQQMVDAFLLKHRGKPGIQRFTVTTGYRTGWLHWLLTMGRPDEVCTETAGWLLEFRDVNDGAPAGNLTNQVAFGINVDGQIVMSNIWTSLFDPDLQLISVAEIPPKYILGFCHYVERLDAKFS